MMRFAMRHLTLLLLPLALVGCSSFSGKNEAPGPAALATGLNAQQDRITYTPVLADRQNLDALQQRLRKLNEAGIPQNNYSLAKAQCWLDTAKTQYHENDRTGYIEESMTESQKIIQALEGNKAAKVGYDTPLVARSERLRDDLWGELTKFKNNGATLACNGACRSRPGANRLARRHAACDDGRGCHPPGCSRSGQLRTATGTRSAGPCSGRTCSGRTRCSTCTSARSDLYPGSRTCAYHPHHHAGALCTLGRYAV
jgi:hypothetical protein